MAAVAAGVFPPVLLGMAIVAGVWAYSCSRDTTCVRGVERFWDGVLASPGAALDG